MSSRSKTTCRNTRNDFILTDCVTRGALLFLNFKLDLYFCKIVSSSVAWSCSTIDPLESINKTGKHLWMICPPDTWFIISQEVNHIIGRLVAEDDNHVGEKADKEPRATGSLAIRQTVLSFRGQRCVHTRSRMIAYTHVRTQCRVARTCVHAVQVPRSRSCRLQIDHCLFGQLFRVIKRSLSGRIGSLPLQ